MDDGQAPREVLPREVLAENIAAAMGRLRLGHAGLAERMQDIGFNWIRQTVGDVLSGRRSLRAAELFGLALALEIRVQRLVTPDDEVQWITLPNGQSVLAKSVTMGAAAVWDGNKIVRLAGDAVWADNGPADPLRTTVEINAHNEHG